MVMLHKPEDLHIWGLNKWYIDNQCKLFPKNAQSRNPSMYRDDLCKKQIVTPCNLTSTKLVAPQPCRANKFPFKETNTLNKANSDQPAISSSVEGTSLSERHKSDTTVTHHKPEH